MQDRYEATSEAVRRRHPTSGSGEAHLVLAVQEPPARASAALPGQYGMLRFELLVVDPEWAFAAWEVPGPSGGVLQLRFYTADGTGPALSGFNLYGEQGRWFLHAALPGQRVEAALGWADGALFHELSRRGPIEFPRNFTVDAEHFEELQVEYERGPYGQLHLKMLQREQPQAWPARLPGAAYPSQPLDWLDDGWTHGNGPGASPPGRRARGIGSSAGTSGQLARGGTRDV